MPNGQALKKSRALLARVLVLRGPESQQTYAQRLADASPMICRSSDNECARVRSEAFGALAGLARMRGRYGEAVEMFRRQLDEATLGYGVEHHLTLRAMHSLAIYLRNAGQLLEASTTSAKLAAKIQNNPVRPGMLAQALELRATLDLDLGRYES